MAQAERSADLESSQVQRLEQWAAAGSTPQQVALRCRIVLLASRGEPVAQIARRLNVQRPTVRLWSRGRDRGFPRPPAQIRAGRITALGSYLEYERRTGPKAKDDRFVRLAAIVRHVVSSDPTSSASSGSVAEAIGTTSESLPCGTG
jgi:hypothetical protein